MIHSFILKFFLKFSQVHKGIWQLSAKHSTSFLKLYMFFFLLLYDQQFMSRNNPNLKSGFTFSFNTETSMYGGARPYVQLNTSPPVGSESCLSLLCYFPFLSY